MFETLRKTETFFSVCFYALCRYYINIDGGNIFVCVFFIVSNRNYFSGLFHLFILRNSVCSYISINVLKIFFFS